MSESTQELRTAPVTRDSLWKLLSSEEAAAVSGMLRTSHLEEGDEYIDLGHLDRGVRWTDTMAPPYGPLLARKFVSESTWHRLVTELADASHASDAPLERK